MQVARQRPFYVLFLLVLVYMSSYIDRVIVGVLGQAIKADLKISDTDLGLLTGITFVIFYGVLGVPIGRLADHLSRKWLLTACLGLWSFMTTLSGFAASFSQLVAARIGVGIGEAGCTPAAYSLLSDLFPPRKRSMAFSVYAAGPPLGIVVGTFGGGWIGQEFGWRAAMIAVGAPGILLAAIVALTTREPRRGEFDSGAMPERAEPFVVALRVFAADKLFLFVMFGMASCAVALYSLSTFAVPYLMRAYDLQLFAAATMFGLSFGVSGALGASVGGIITDYAGTRNARWYAGVPAIGYAGAGLLLTTAVFMKDHRVFIALFVVGSVLANIALAPSQAVVLNRLTPRMRASGSAILLLAASLAGLGLGPPLTGVISDAVAQRTFATVGVYSAQCPGGQALAGATQAAQAACAHASFQGLQVALAVMLSFYLLAALMYVFAIPQTTVAPPSTAVVGQLAGESR